MVTHQVSSIVDPYQTTAMNRLNIEPIKKVLQRALIEGTLAPTNEAIRIDNMPLPEQGIYYYLGSDPIDQFNHPVILNHENKVAVVIDGRRLAKPSLRGRGIFTPINLDFYKFVYARARMMKMFYEGESGSLAPFLPAHLTMFCDWIPGRIASRYYGINPESKQRMMIICAAFVLFQYTGIKGELTEENRRQLMVRIRRQFSSIDEMTLTDVIGRLTVMNNVDDLVSNIKELSNSILLDTLDRPTFLQLINIGWDSFNGREMISVAVENQPTFLAMLLAAISTSTYGSTVLGKSAKMILGKGTLDLIKYANQLGIYQKLY